MHSQSEPRTLAAVKAPISREALDQLFREARTHSTWLPETVPVELLRKAYELARLGPTSANGSASSRAWQCRQNHGCSCNRDHRLGHGIP